MVKPRKLQSGDSIASVSPSWGGAEDPELRWRYEQKVKRLEDLFGLKIIPIPNSLKGEGYPYNNPEARAEDLMAAFKDKILKPFLPI